MSTDPYHAVQSEIQSSLQTAGQLRASFLRIRSTARDGNEELEWAKNELKATLSTLEADLEDLEESVKIVESTGARMFGLEEAEVMQRRRYVEHVRREIESMRAEVEGRQPPAHSSQGARTPATPTPPPPDDEQAQWTREEQQMILQQQDQTLNSITGTLTTLAQQAGLIGQEVVEHNEMLEDLEQGVDRTDSRLGSAMRKMRKFIRDTEETKSGWCIAILIVVLLILLAAVIFI
ncbi:syntaxin 6, N-terminal-domain-containing protein [Vararia minispora EC-137]|uniref:Syntaxin 6, N-terminal-domain-containing protein n=1 Tax=Vararia minispora EC-137 TaxID=1314806 RepID=A0ACB8QVA7_9AGAM|nr:syntaxin 6, N-terminal-domain-containing protein [Vararia minispora EC-137]